MTITGPSIGFNDYVLGHSNQELERRVKQSRFRGELSDHLLRAGTASAGEIGIATLANRLREEAMALRATHVAPPLIAAWTRTPVGRPERP